MCEDRLPAASLAGIIHAAGVTATHEIASWADEPKQFFTRTAKDITRHDKKPIW